MGGGSLLGHAAQVKGFRFEGVGQLAGGLHDLPGGRGTISYDFSVSLMAFSSSISCRSFSRMKVILSSICRPSCAMLPSIALRSFRSIESSELT